MNYSTIYDKLLAAHSYFPYWFGKGKSLPPLRVQFELTYLCNLKCFMCYQDREIFSPRDELDTSEWIDLIKQLPKFSLITLIGGEPLVRTDFKKIVAFAATSHSCNLVTNGVLLSDEINRFLIKKRLVLIGVSLDGTGRIHDSIRGVRGIYDKVIANVKNLQEQKGHQKSRYPLLDVKTVVTKVNLENLRELFGVVEGLRADFFTLSLPKVSVNQFNPWLKENWEEFPAFDYSLFKKIDFIRFKEILGKIIQKSSKTKIRLYPQFKIEDFGQQLYNPKLIQRNFLPCQQPWSGVQITAKGDVYPCLSLKMGNVKKQSLSKIWNNQKFVFFRKNLKKKQLFPDCLGCCYLKQR